MRNALLVVALVLGCASGASAEWQFKPFGSVVFGGSTTFVDLERAAGAKHLAVGASATVLGEVFGVEGDVAQALGFFATGDQHLVPQSSVSTITGNIVVAVPRRLTQYTLRPYVAGGFGVMRVNMADVLGVLKVSETLPAIDVGGGVTGFLNHWVGLNWEVRYFRSVGGPDGASGVSFGAEEVRYWRATMGLVIRY